MSRHLLTNGELLLIDGDVTAFHLAFPLTVSDAIDKGIPMYQLKFKVSQNAIKRQIEFELSMMAKMFNLNLGLTSYQIGVIADILISEFNYESIQDIQLCFRRAIAGHYGEVFRIDSNVICLWFKKYLEEKSMELEKKVKKEDTQREDKLKEEFRSVGLEVYTELKDVTKQLLKDYVDKLKLMSEQDKVLTMTDDYIISHGQKRPYKKGSIASGFQSTKEEIEAWEKRFDDLKNKINIK